MSLATRCAVCGTVFRVVQDQLKVSEGWVRCGRCNEVFNALDGLFDLDRESAPAWSPSQLGNDLQSTGAAPLGMVGDSGATHPPQDDVGSTLAFESSLSTEIDSDSATDASALAAPPETLSIAGDDADAGGFTAPAPMFLRQAEQAARWQRPWVRTALALALVALGLSLATQVAVHQRDILAARWPQTLPLLEALCEPLACRIEPLRRLDSLAVESSGLTKLDDTTRYQLQVSLRNRDALPLLLPGFDLTLTDSRGAVVARKLLNASDFGAATPKHLAAGAELALQTVLDVGDHRVTGYSVEIFYP